MGAWRLRRLPRWLWLITAATATGAGYGWRGGYWGWRGGYGWGWWGLPAAGLFLATLPFYYSTYWWNGVPYYYANDNYTCVAAPRTAMSR